MFAGAGSYASASRFIDGFAPAIGLAAAVALVGAVVSLAVPARGGAPARDVRAMYPDLAA